MAKPDFNRVLRITLVVLSLGLIAILAIVWLQQSKTEHLTLAAGAPSGESYILGNALKTVVERHYPRIRITLLETGGTVENLQMLEDGRAQLATAQSDILPGPRARALAVLYDDTFQLLVPKDSQVQRPRGFARSTDCAGTEWRANFSLFSVLWNTSAFIKPISTLWALMMTLRRMHS